MPGIKPQEAGRLAALGSDFAIDHFQRLGVSHIELMPIAAWMDERHLAPLGLTNAWGYNSVAFQVPDPRLMPDGWRALAALTEHYREAGIGIILDIVLNHTAESDQFGATISLRGLDSAYYYRHARENPGVLINDTGCGNTLALDRPEVLRLAMDTLRFWRRCGVAGFRFDLATVLGRSASGYSPDGALLSAIRQDPELRDVILIAEPWDLGPGGYQLGGFPEPFLEWNGRFRDDVRRFWRGDRDMAGSLATRLAGSADIFASAGRSAGASINYLAAHDGFTLRDLVSYCEKHNEANGEQNRDGTTESYSWNNGAEGETPSEEINAARKRDIRAMLATLFFARGTPMLQAGDELGRTQGGNNNAYAQDNERFWLDWEHADEDLIDFVARLAAIAQDHPLLRRRRLPDGATAAEATGRRRLAAWRRSPPRGGDWRRLDAIGMLLAISDEAC